MFFLNGDFDLLVGGVIGIYDLLGILFSYDCGNLPLSFYFLLDRNLNLDFLVGGVIGVDNPLRVLLPDNRRDPRIPLLFLNRILNFNFLVGGIIGVDNPLWVLLPDDSRDPRLPLLLLFGLVFNFDFLI